MATSQLQQTPPFFFSVDELRPHPQVAPRSSPAGWLPPRPLGSNYISSRGRWFIYSGTVGQHAAPIAQPPNASFAEHFDTWSLYYAHGTTFIVPYDASQTMVSTGSQSESNVAEVDDADSDDEEAAARTRARIGQPHRLQHVDWSGLRFSAATNTGVSFASYAGTSARLLQQYRDQDEWVAELLPQRYYSVTQNPDRLGNTGSGGLVGSLPLLIGLVALSGEEASRDSNLARSMRAGGWQAHGQGSDHGDKRGVVVRVYARKRTEGNRAILTTQLMQELRDFEGGHYGKIYV